MPVSLLSLVLGFMMMTAWVTKDNRQSRLALTGASQQDRVTSGPIDVQEKYEQLTQEVAKLQADKTRMEKVLGESSGSTKVLNDNLQDAKIQAGLTEVEGPGVIVTLHDASNTKDNAGFAQDQAIHDFDLLRVVNELWAAGAEAIAVNGHRVAIGTSFRCVGNTIMVEGIRVAPPITIRAIGDAPTLNGAINIPGGVLSEIRSSDPNMVQVELARQMRLPAYTGPTTRHYAVVPRDTK